VGKATDLRSRVRSYFYGDPRRRIRDLLHETQSIAVQRHASMLEAEIAEADAIAREMPPYNRQGKSQASWYVRVVLRAKVPKVAAARTSTQDGSIYLGPFPSRTTRALIDAFRDALALHRCAHPERCAGCAFSQLGKCAGTDAPVHRRQVASLAMALQSEPDLLLAPLVARMLRLAGQERFEEAAELRDRGALLERTVHRHLETQALLDAGEIIVSSGGRAFLLRAGRLAGAVDAQNKHPEDIVASLLRPDTAPVALEEDAPGAQREAAIINAWLRRTSDARVLHVRGPWAQPSGARPRGLFRPVEPAG
jgi:DNA polymerase-3 subunit epsilon